MTFEGLLSLALWLTILGIYIGYCYLKSDEYEEFKDVPALLKPGVVMYMAAVLIGGLFITLTFIYYLTYPIWQLFK